jgi:hypothetical protein
VIAHVCCSKHGYFLTRLSNLLICLGEIVVQHIPVLIDGVHLIMCDCSI